VPSDSHLALEPECYVAAPSSRHVYTLDDYLGVEEMSSVRREYLNGEIFAMAGRTPEYSALSAAMLTSSEASCAGGLADRDLRALTPP
jgi:hypothetical protein